MLYCVEIDVKVPDGIDPARLEDIKAREKVVSGEYQRAGEWLHLQRTHRAGCAEIHVAGDLTLRLPW